MKQILVSLILILLLSSCSDNTVKPEVHPSINKILFAGTVNKESGLFSIWSDGSHLIRICDFQDSYQPRWTPDGKHIMFIKGRSLPYEIFIMDSVGSGVKKITDGQEYAVSFKGDKMAYILYDQQEISWEVYCINLDGTNNVQLTNSKKQKFGLHWCPTRDEIAFTENDNIAGTYEIIYRINLGNKSLDTLAMKNYELPQISDWSVDGKYILFGANHADVYRINVYTKEILQLTNVIMRDEAAKFSQDCKKIVFQSGREFSNGKNVTQVYLMNSDGTSQHKLSFNTNGAGYPQWSPDGSMIAYAAAQDNNIWTIDIVTSEENTRWSVVTLSGGYPPLIDWYPKK